MNKIKTVFKLIFKPVGYYQTPTSRVLCGLIISQLDNGKPFTQFLTKKQLGSSEDLTIKRRFKAVKLAFQGKLVSP